MTLVVWVSISATPHKCMVTIRY